MAVYFRDTEDVIWKNTLDVIWIKPKFLQAELGIEQAATKLAIETIKTGLEIKETET